MAEKKAAKAAKKVAAEHAAETQKTEPKAADTGDVGQAELQAKADARNERGFAGTAEGTDNTAASAAGKD